MAEECCGDRSPAEAWAEAETEAPEGADVSWLLVEEAKCRAPLAAAAAADAAPAPPRLRVEFVLERPAAPLEPCRLDAVMSVVAPSSAEGARAPLHLVAVLDKSGSMAGRKLELVVQTMRFVLRHLADRDALGIVAFDSDVTVLAPLTPCGVDGKRLLESALDRLSSGSATNLSGGLLRGLALHGEGPRPAAPPRPLQRALFGNSYRCLTSEEAEARKREDGAEHRRPHDKPRVHEWTMELRLEAEEDAATVREVVYKLRVGTFPQATVSTSEPPFKLTRLGWSAFTIHADVVLHDGRVLQLAHDLQFGQSEGFHWVLLPLSTEPPPSPAVAERLPSEDSEQAVVRSTFLFTDGHANRGIEQAEPLRQAACAALDALGGRRCGLSTFGFGADHCAELLQGLAEAGRGVYCYVENEEKIAEAFGEALGGLLSTTHQNVRLRLELLPGTVLAVCKTAHPVRGPEESADGGQWAEVDLGDLYAEERRDVLVTLSFGAAEAPWAQPLGRLSACGFSVHALKPEEPSSLALALERCDGAAAGAPEPLVERQRQRQLVVAALEAARSSASKGRFDEAKERLRAASDSLSASELAACGDAVTAELLRDLAECLAGLRSQADYRDVGSKRMSQLQHSHGQQRCCGMEDSICYTTTMTMTMRAAFRDGTG